VRKWLTPDLTWIHGVGLFPNIEVDPPADQPTNQDAVLDKGVQVVLDALANPWVTFPPPPTFVPSPSPLPSPSPAAITDHSVVTELSLATPIVLG